MTQAPMSLLGLGTDPALMQSLAASGWAVASSDQLNHDLPEDAVLVWAPTPQALTELVQRKGLMASALDSAWLVMTPVQDQATEMQLLDRGVECILAPSDAATLSAQLRHAVLRKRIERAARTAYATDLATGLPHQAQLLEHMTQLLALREREPAPMVLLVLQVDGLAQAAGRLGAESGNVLRRKVAVRLRSGLRASDVVAAIASDSFGVLLGHLENKGDADGVAAKLVRTLQLPFLVAGQTCRVQATVGMALYPDHGKDAETLLKRACAQAGQVAVLGAEGYASNVRRLGGDAANDGAD